jgi:hypothetical protein
MMDEGLIAGLTAILSSVGAWLRGENKAGGAHRRVDRLEKDLRDLQGDVVTEPLCAERVKRLETAQGALGREVKELIRNGGRNS